MSLDKVRVITGDTGTTPYGGGTWASRGAGIGGEAVLQAGKALRSNILDLAAAMLQDKAQLDVAAARSSTRPAARAKLPLAEVAAWATSAPTPCR